MSDFNGEGFASFPNTYEDNKQVGMFSNLTPEALEYKLNEYGQFLQRPDLMARAKRIGNRVLDHLLFEAAWRDGIYNKEETDATVLPQSTR